MRIEKLKFGPFIQYYVVAYCGQHRKTLDNANKLSQLRGMRPYRKPQTVRFGNDTILDIRRELCWAEESDIRGHLNNCD